MRFRQEEDLQEHIIALTTTTTYVDGGRSYPLPLNIMKILANL